ncbi:MAG TPA: hypothetical protein VNI35_03260, partial [Nitrospira sp.]|nr:hypothetical protein [Nitrospira sp.]
MNRGRFFLWATPLILVACATTGNKVTIANLRHMNVEIKEEKIEGGLEKAMQSYQRFLKDTPDSTLTPEAIRRLADLKIEKEYGALTAGAGSTEGEVSSPSPKRAGGKKSDQEPAGPSAGDESETDFEARATRMQSADSIAAAE